jgi:hypothetical protein
MEQQRGTGRFESDDDSIEFMRKRRWGVFTAVMTCAVAIGIAGAAKAAAREARAVLASDAPVRLDTQVVIGPIEWPATAMASHIKFKKRTPAVAPVNHVEERPRD